MFFVRLKPFRKKNKQACNCLDNLIHNATGMNPYQPTYRASMYTHLFLFVKICENLFESILIYDHLWESIFQVFMKTSKRMNTIM